MKIVLIEYMKHRREEMTRQAILRAFGLLAVILAFSAAVPASGRAAEVESTCTCTVNQFLCTYADGSCTCLSEGKVCKDTDAE
jgi:hypothetical protein